MEHTILTYARTENRKTGDVPTVAVGTEEARTASCAGCPLRPREEGGDGQCYARGSRWSRPDHVVRQGEAAVAAGRRASFLRGAAGFRAALAARAPSAKIVRFGSTGDPSIWPPDAWAEMHQATRDAGLVAIGYTHQWAGRGAHLRGQLMASCDTVEQAAAASAAGWFPALIVGIEEPGPAVRLAPGLLGVICPAQRDTTGRVTCNNCRMCDGKPRKRGDDALVVCFRNHSNAERVRKLARERVAAKRAKEAAACST